MDYSKLKCEVCDGKIELKLVPLDNGSFTWGFFNASIRGKPFPLCDEHYKEWNDIIERELTKFLKKELATI